LGKVIQTVVVDTRLVSPSALLDFIGFHKGSGGGKTKRSYPQATRFLPLREGVNMGNRGGADVKKRASFFVLAFRFFF